MTRAELEKRVAELEAELAWRRNHVCQQSYAPMAAEACNCAGGVMTVPCPVHRPWPPRIWITAAANGAADHGFGNVIVNTTGCADRPVITMPFSASGCAAGWGGQVFTVNVPA